MKPLIGLSLIVFIFCSACAKPAQPDPLALVGAKHFGAKQTFFVFSVPSFGEQDDATFIKRSKTYGAAPVAKQLAALLAKGETTELRVVVGGDSSKKTTQVLLDAVDINKERSLGGLVLLFIGQHEDAKRVKPVLNEKLATFYFLPNAALPSQQSSS